MANFGRHIRQFLFYIRKKLIILHFCLFTEKTLPKHWYWLNIYNGTRIRSESLEFELDPSPNHLINPMQIRIWFGSDQICIVIHTIAYSQRFISLTLCHMCKDLERTWITKSIMTCHASEEKWISKCLGMLEILHL